MGPPTDLWALGVLLYEGLSNVPPFRGATRHDLFESILRGNPPSPRGWDDSIPLELEAVSRFGQLLRAAETLNRSSLLPVPYQCGDVEPLGIVDRAVPFADGDDSGAVLGVQDVRHVGTDVAEALD